MDTFNIDEKVRYDYMNRATLKSIKQGIITYFTFLITSPPNSNFYSEGRFHIIDIGEGEFLAREFELKIGNHINSAGVYSDTRTDKFVSGVIDEYSFGTFDKPGIVSGKFSGVLTYSKDPDPYKTFPIDCSFSFPTR